MANRYRGEIAASLDGATYTLVLTLGALAELESAFGTDDMLALAGRFSSGRISARDCVRIIGAGLRGAGHDIADDSVARMRGDDGAATFVDIVARLLAATFGGPVAAPVAGAIVSAATDAMTAPAAPPQPVAVMAKATPPDTGPAVPFAFASPLAQPAPMHPASAPFPGPR